MKRDISEGVIAKSLTARRNTASASKAESCALIYADAKSAKTQRGINLQPSSKCSLFTKSTDTTSLFLLEKSLL